MKKLLSRVALASLAGCSYKFHAAPGSDFHMANADYTVLGETSAEACGTYIIIDWAHLFADKSGSVSGGGGDPISALLSALGGNPEESRAMYEALEKMPEATHVMAHRSHTTEDGIVMFGRPIFGKRCTRVVGHGVKIGKGPVPNAQ